MFQSYVVYALYNFLTLQYLRHELVGREHVEEVDGVGSGRHDVIEAGPVAQRVAKGRVVGAVAVVEVEPVSDTASHRRVPRHTSGECDDKHAFDTL